MSVELEILKVVGQGLGLAHHQGETYFVRGALPGETVAVAVEGRRRGIVEARATAVLADPHPARVADICPHAEQCGGCDWPHVAASAGAPLKAQVAAESARTKPELGDLLARAPVRESALHYRLRSRLHWDSARGVLGFFGHHSHTAVDIPHCRLISPRLSRSMPALIENLKQHATQDCDLEWLEDLSGDTALLGLLSLPDRSRRGRRNPRQRRKALRALPRSTIGSLVDGCHVLDSRGRRRDGWGASSVTMALDAALEVPLGSFFQVNTHLVPWLFAQVRDLVGADQPTIVDLHGGVGFLAAAANAAHHRETILVEPNEGAARAAQSNLAHATVHHGSTALAFLKNHRPESQNVLVLTDPPRAGLGAPERRLLIDWKPARILMLACDPATWARDAADLMAAGYGISHLELVDLFPSTHHVEILAVLEPE